MEDFASYPPPFLVDGRLVQPDLNRITGPQGMVQIEPRVMQVLLVLVQQPRVVVSRESLLDQVWADRIVGEENLTRAISELRRIFADDSRRPRIIETIRNHGYRLIAAVSPAPDNISDVPVVTSDPVGDEIPVVAASDSPWRGRLGWIILLVVALVAGGWFLTLERGNTPAEYGSSYWQGPPVPLTSYPGRERHPGLSPDGTRVAFVWADANMPPGCVNALYVKQRNSEAPLRLTEAPGWVAWPAWSPDGQSVSFIQGNGRDIALCVVPSLGGAVRSLYRSRDLIEGVAWLPGGRDLVFSALDTMGGTRKLMVLNLDSLTVRGVPASVAIAGEDVFPCVQPGGKGLAWTHRDPGGESTLCTGQWTATDVRRRVGNMGVIGSACWTPDGEGLVFSAAPEGLFKLWTINFGDNQPRLLNTGPGSALSPTVSLRSAELAFEQVRMDHGLILMRVEGQDPWQLESTSLALSTRGEFCADFSPDGTRIAMVSNRSGFPEVWLSDDAGSGLDQLTELKSPVLNHLRWSPSGEKLAFQVNRGQGNTMMVMDAQGGLPQPVEIEGPDITFSSWAPGGRTLLVTRRNAAGWQLLEVGIPGEQNAKPRALLSTPATSGEISLDGGKIFFTRPDKEGLWKQDLNGGAPELIIPNLWTGDVNHWRLSGDDHIAWVERIAGLPYLVWQDLATGHSSLVADLPGLAAGGISVGPGGRAFLYAQGTVVAADLMLLPKKASSP